MFCNVCGKKIQGNETYCPYCESLLTAGSGGNGYFDEVWDQVDQRAVSANAAPGNLAEDEEFIQLQKYVSTQNKQIRYLKKELSNAKIVGVVGIASAVVALIISIFIGISLTSSLNKAKNVIADLEKAGGTQTESITREEVNSMIADSMTNNTEYETKISQVEADMEQLTTAVGSMQTELDNMDNYYVSNKELQDSLASMQKPSGITKEEFDKHVENANENYATKSVLEEYAKKEDVSKSTIIARVKEAMEDEDLINYLKNKLNVGQEPKGLDR